MPIEDVAVLRSEMANFEIRKPDPSVHRDLERGWLFPMMVTFDTMLWGRWTYWGQLAEQQLTEGEKALPHEPIPQIEFLHEGGVTWAETDGGTAAVESSSARAGWARTRKMLEASLETISHSWQGWSSPEYLGYFLDWLLFGFGYLTEAPKEPIQGASDRLYQVFNCHAMQLWPYDYIGDIFAEIHVGRAAAYYPTPHNLSHMMADMTFGEAKKSEKDARLWTTCDPCVGTGRLLFWPSNVTLCLAGVDINPIMVKATLVNSFLYMPWLARPVEWVWNLAQSGEPQAVFAPPGEPAEATDPPPETPETATVPGVSLSRRARKQRDAGQETLF